MAGRDILISVSPGETRIACTDNAKLVSIDYIREATPSSIGSIFLGRVKALNNGLQAAFVDIGLARDGFLSVDDVRPWESRGTGTKISEHLKEGDTVLVQVLRDSMDGKGAKLTARCVLNGVGVIFKPGQPGVQLSGKIDGKKLRQSLKDSLSSICPEGDGFIVRTVARSMPLPELEREARQLVDQWGDLQTEISDLKPPAAIGSIEHPVLAILRKLASGDIQSITIDDVDVHAAIHPQLEVIADNVVIHKGPHPLLETDDVEEQIEAALTPTVTLPCGGGIHIEATRAITAIDVDTALAQSNGREEGNTLVNQEAAAEIPRQLALRKVGGQILIDFVPMKKKANRDRVYETLKTRLSQITGKPRIYGYTQLGLMEISRLRESETLVEVLCDPVSSPHRSGLSSAYEVLRAVLNSARMQSGASFAISAHPGVIDALKGPANPALRETEKQLGLKLTLESSDLLQPDQYQVMRK